MKIQGIQRANLIFVNLKHEKHKTHEILSKIKKVKLF